MDSQARIAGPSTRAARGQSARRGPSERGPVLAAFAGLAGGLAAVSCCILPLVLFSLGVTGAWIGNFTQLAPYQPYFIGFAALALGTGYWLVYRSSVRACAEGAACARPLSTRLVRSVLVLATVLTAAAIAFDYLAPSLLS